MDNLARNAFLARQAGMSYGKWKAMQPPVQIVKKETPTETKEMKVCPWCGEKFKPNMGNKQKYCDVSCQRTAYYENNKKKVLERMKEYREKRKEGEKIGQA